MKKIILSIIALLSVTVMEAQKNQTHLTLNNGVAIPQFGLGVYSIPAGEVTYNSVLTALKAGYRHIDTAGASPNQANPEHIVDLDMVGTGYAVDAFGEVMAEGGYRYPSGLR